MPIEWKKYHFHELPRELLYEILRIRQEVFILEQHCFYLDADGLDREAIHLCGFDGQKLMAYARLLPPGQVYPQPSFGRVLILPQYRGRGLGKALTHSLIRLSEAEFGRADLCISAQAYLKDFYREFGFRTRGEEYLDAGIPHIKMIRK
jgi:ElaA protein